jgi:hypothetical protein
MRCHYPTCAVVGSAGNLRTARLGPAIDAHDAVFRINAAPTMGHEAAVGARTTWRIHNSEKPFFMAALNASELQVGVCHMSWIGACQRQAFSGMHADGFALLNPVFYSQLWDMLGRPRHKQTPSTGLLAIAIALGVCGRVRLFGYSRSTDARIKCGRHYWECPRWAETKAGYHDPKHTFHAWLEEERLRLRWLERGVVEDGAARFGPGEAGAAAVRAAERAAQQPQQLHRLTAPTAAAS